METLVLHELHVDSMLSMETITVSIITFTPAFKHLHFTSWCLSKSVQEIRIMSLNYVYTYIIYMIYIIYILSHWIVKNTTNVKMLAEKPVTLVLKGPVLMNIWEVFSKNKKRWILKDLHWVHLPHLFFFFHVYKVFMKTWVFQTEAICCESKQILLILSFFNNGPFLNLFFSKSRIIIILM